jgi:hypothetical protein
VITMIGYWGFLQQSDNARNCTELHYSDDMGHKRSVSKCSDELNDHGSISGRNRDYCLSDHVHIGVLLGCNGTGA